MIKYGLLFCRRYTTLHIHWWLSTFAYLYNNKVGGVPSRILKVVFDFKTNFPLLGQIMPGKPYICFKWGSFLAYQTGVFVTCRNFTYVGNFIRHGDAKWVACCTMARFGWCNFTLWMKCCNFILCCKKCVWLR
jgi:hypothetical protein